MATVRFERQPVDFATVTRPASVTCLEIAFCNCASLDGIECLTKVQELQIHYCRSLRDISAIGQLSSLIRINLYSLPNIECHFSVERLINLEHLSFNAVKQLPTIRGVETLPKLTHLGLSRVKVLDNDYHPITESSSLTRVFWFGGPFKAPALKEIKRLRPDILVGGNAVNP